MKTSYNIKGWNGKKWEYLGMGYFNYNDTEIQKEKEITRLKKKYGDYYFNISNFFNVYN